MTVGSSVRCSRYQLWPLKFHSALPFQKATAIYRYNPVITLLLQRDCHIISYWIWSHVHFNCVRASVYNNFVQIIIT